MPSTVLIVDDSATIRRNVRGGARDESGACGRGNGRKGGGTLHCGAAEPGAALCSHARYWALAQYVGAFDPRFLALHGDLAATQRAAKEFKIYFEKRKSGNSYTVDHSAQSYIIDPQGRLRLLVRQERIAQDPADDLREILKPG